MYIPCEFFIVLLFLKFVSNLSLSPSSDSSGSCYAASSNMFALNAKVYVRSEMRESWMKEIRADQVCTRRDEPGNVQFIVGEDTTTPNVFYLHEEFINEQAFRDHQQTPHFAKYKEFCDEKNPFVKDMELITYHLKGEELTTNKRPIVTVPVFGLNVKLYPKPEVRDEFLKVIENNKAGTDDKSKEPLALQYTYGESTAEENVFLFHEQYIGENHGKEGFEAHQQAPHFISWEDFVKTDPFVKPPEIEFFHVVEQAQDTKDE